MVLPRRLSSPILVCPLALIVALAILVPPIKAVAQPWVVESVHWSFLDPTVMGEENSLALDAAGRPHVAYSEQTGKGYLLWYSYKAAENWFHHERVDGQTFSVGVSPSLALDAVGNSHLCYMDWTTYDLKYARKSGGVWTIEAADSSANEVGWSSSIAVDGVGNPHMSYADATTSQIRYARKVAGVWTIDTVGGSPTGFCSLALDASGNPHVCFESWAPRDLMYASKSGGVWTVETADGSANNEGAWSSMAVDASGSPHVSYTDRTANDLKYASKSGGIWTIEIVDGVGSSVGESSSLELDGSGNPHVSYRDATNNNLKYAIKAGGQWSLVTVSGEPNDEPQYNSLALDVFGNPHITYYNANTDDPMYVYVPPPTGFGVETVSGEPVLAGLLGAGRALAVTPNPAMNGALRVLYRVGSGTPETDLTLYDVTGRRVRTLGSGSASSGLASVTWDGRDDGDRPVSAGVYFIRLMESGVPRDAVRILVIR